MIDPLTRSAWLSSVIIHAVVILIATVGLFPRRSPPPAILLEQAVPAAPAAPKQADAFGDLIFAEDSFVVAPKPPALPPAPLPSGIVPMVPTSMARPDRDTSRGQSGTQRSDIALPPLNAPPTPELERIRSRMSARAATDWAENHRRDTAQHLDYLIRHAYLARWRHHATSITNRDLVVWLQPDAQGRIVQGGLFMCTTGVEELDRAITHWLLNEKLGLPQLDAASIEFFRIRLP